MKKQDEIDLWDGLWDEIDNSDIPEIKELLCYCDFIDEVIEEIGMSFKRAEYILEKWSNIGLTEYGVGVWFGWIEPGITRESLKRG